MSEMTTYCTQMNGNCGECSLVNYGRDCRNNPVSRGVDEGHCLACNRPVIYCEHYKNYDESEKAKYNRCRDEDPNPIDHNLINEFFDEKEVPE